LQHACLVLRHELMTWYGRRHREHPHEQLTRLSAFSLKTVGEPGRRKLKAKGAKTYGLRLFLGCLCSVPSPPSILANPGGRDGRRRHG
jgi:hypothetical protein